MQKKIIALAVAGLVSGAAFAQSNVTVYGRADIGYAYSKSDFKKFHGVEQGNGIGGGGSRIGFIGEEGLGNGLKATFKFEYGTPIDEGGATFTARYAHAGLAGNFGKVDVGRVGTPSDYYMGGTSPWGINGHEPINVFRARLGNGLVDGTRWNNSIAYSSPNFSGVDLMGIYSFGERTKASDTNDKTDPADGGRLGLGVRYANGPIYAAVIYHTQEDSHAGAAKLKDGGDGWGIGGAYDFKVVKVYANYFQTKMNKDSSIGDKKETAWSLAVGVPVSTAGTVVAEYAQYKDKNVKDNTTKGYSVGYRHNLSKRTSLYTYISRFDNDDDMNAGWQSSRTAAGRLGVPGETQTNFSVGILHLF
jgi:predicted porin